MFTTVVAATAAAAAVAAAAVAVLLKRRPKYTFTSLQNSKKVVPKLRFVLLRIYSKTKRLPLAIAFTYSYYVVFFCASKNEKKRYQPLFHPVF